MRRLMHLRTKSKMIIQFILMIYALKVFHISFFISFTLFSFLRSLFCFFLCFFFLFFFLFLLIAQNFSILLTSSFKLYLKLLEVFFRGKFGTKLFILWFLVTYVICCPGPGVITCLHLLQLAKYLNRLNEMINNAFVSFIGSH